MPKNRGEGIHIAVGNVERATVLGAVAVLALFAILAVTPAAGTRRRGR